MPIKIAQKSVQLGELIDTAYDVATRYSSDPREVSRLATRVVLRVLRRARGRNREVDWNRSVCRP